MTDPRVPSGRPPLLWLGLLLIAPAAFFLGQLTGNLPGGSSRTAEAPSRPAVAANPAAAYPSDPGSEPATGEAEGLRWRWMSDATEESRRTGKPVLIDFNADWCPPCQRMKREVFEDREMAGAIAASVVPVSIVDGANASRDEELRRRFSIQAYPTLVVLNPATGQYLSHRGYGNPGATRQWIASAAQQVR